MKTQEQKPVDKRFVVMYADGGYYGSYSPLGIWETYEAAEKARRKWEEANPWRESYTEEVDYHEEHSEE
jgi:hypothetical protein